MAKKLPDIKEYRTEFCSDDKGEFYRVYVGFKGDEIGVLMDIADFEEFSKFNWSVLSVRGLPKYMSRELSASDGKKRKRQQLHQFLMGTLKGTEIDHIDGDGFNCRRCNMRVATHAQNRRNSIKRKKGTSGYKGVVWNKENKRWLAQIRYKGKGIYLGSFRKEIVDGIDEGEKKAARAYDKAAVKYFGTFALVNMPTEQNMVQTLKGENFKKSYLFNEQEIKEIEQTITDLKELTNNEVMEILEAMAIKRVVDLCHYFGCGIESLLKEIKSGVVIGKKHAG